MILSGTQAINQGLVTGLVDVSLQTQQCGVDFTLKKVANWTTAGTIDFDNTNRVIAENEAIEFVDGKVFLSQGTYFIEFNETVHLPNNIMATVQTRTSLLRSGAGVVGGAIDPGFSGVIAVVLEVWNEQGITLYRNAKIAQWIFARLEQATEQGYSGRYQGIEQTIA